MPIKVPPPAPPGRMKILVVDDEDLVRLSLSGTLTMLGYEVIQAVDGQEAVRMFREHADEIAIIITDLCMPRMYGNEVLLAVRAIKPEVKVILSSGLLGQSIPHAFSKLPFSAFLTKPHSIAALEAALAECLDTPTEIHSVLEGGDRDALPQPTCKKWRSEPP